MSDEPTEPIAPNLKKVMVPFIVPADFNIGACAIVAIRDDGKAFHINGPFDQPEGALVLARSLMDYAVQNAIPALQQEQSRIVVAGPQLRGLPGGMTH